MYKIRWRANYKDGTYLDQYKDTNKYLSLTHYLNDLEQNSYHDIDRKNLDNFALFKDNEEHPFLAIRVKEDQQLIYRARAFNTGGQFSGFCVLAGVKMNINGSKRCVINYAFSNDVIEMDDEKKDIDFYPEEM